MLRNGEIGSKLSTPVDPKKVRLIVITVFLILLTVGSVLLLDIRIHDSDTSRVCKRLALFWREPDFGRFCVCMGVLKAGPMMFDAPSVGYCMGQGISIENPLNLPSIVKDLFSRSN
jgi:hypothetical protein